jgi:ABC-type glycerol-3-phosphate transport system substrate-binding protein
MNLDEEMKLWKERANDEFGKVLKKIKKATKDYLYSWEECGIEYNVLSEYITGYALYGNRMFAAKHIYNILENYDILGNHRNVKKLVNKMMDLANYIK